MFVIQAAGDLYKKNKKTSHTSNYNIQQNWKNTKRQYNSLWEYKALQPNAKKYKNS